MKKCQCGKLTEAERYEFCNSCWKAQDERYINKILSYLVKMTQVALEHDFIIAEPIESASFTYEAKYGPKLYWNYTANSYCMKLPNGKVITP